MSRMHYVSQETARDLVTRRARIRVHSRALGCEDLVMAEGRVYAYCASPVLYIEHDDGSRSSWSVDLPIDEVEQPAEAAPNPTAVDRG